jgi:hypothetical protein
LPQEYGNLLSAKQNSSAAINKLQNEIDLGRMAGPFDNRPISNLRCVLIGMSFFIGEYPKLQTSYWSIQFSEK